MRLLTCFLVASIFPALAQTTFKIQNLGTPATAIREHFAVTGDTNGALAVSPTDVFYNGDTATGRFSVDLQSAQQLPPATTRYFALVSDLADGSVYEFVNRAGSPPVDTRLNPSNVNSRPLTHLKNVASGNRVNLSASITLSGNEAIFAGYSRVVIVDGTTVYDIALPSGTITQWTVPALSLVPCEQWMSWGVAEFFDNALHLAYVRTNRIISRTRVPDGVTSDILTTNGQGLRNMCAFSVLPSQNRWYFQHSDASVLGGQNVNGNNDEFLGYAPATFVTTTDSVPPTTTLNPTTQSNANDWYNTSVTVSVGANDTGGSGVKNTQCSINGGAHQIVGSSISLASEGKNTLSCFSTDNANNIESPAVTLTVKIDSVAPTITLSNRTAPNSQGWNNTNVIVNWACSDSGSGPVAPTVSNTLTTEGTEQSSTGTCTDLAGNTATNQQTKINIDKTPPAIEWGTAAPAANAAGWNNTDISVVYSATDNLSGMPSGTATVNVAIKLEGQGLTGSVTLTDIAGNSTTYTTQTFNIDKTAPTIVGSRSPAANGAGWNNVDVTVNFACTDALSGLEGSGPPATTLGEGVNQSVTKSCMDKAGNSATAIVSDINVDKTAPTIEGSRLPLANAAGWNNVDVTVSFSCADTLSGPDGAAPMPTMLGEGANQSVTKSCVDKAGNSASATVNAINIDKTAPVANPSLSPAANGFGWNNTNVTVNFGWSDALSGLGVCTATQSVTDEGTSQSASATCTDKAGNSFTATKSGINLDKTSPTITYTSLPAANAAGWNNTDVTVTFIGADSLSGLVGCSGPFALTTEGAGQTTTGICIDKAGNSVTASSVTNIDKTAPLPTAIAGTPNPVAAGTSLKVTAKVIDALASGRVSGAEYMVENGSWTQLSPVDGTYNSPSEDVFANVTAGRTPGVYDLCVRATDVAGNTGPSDCVFVVIYDPNGGFVTGGGWITSPMGAYPANPALTGKANFGFVSKYLKGATVPTGETQFEFKLASITFQSTVYEWLTIAGARAQYKGSGKINGSGDYGFLLTAIDGETNGGGGADKFRIKIWDKINSNNIVYDNQLGVSDDSNPTTTLGGGSIVIHTNTK